jgi:WD40 repeat protein
MIRLAEISPDGRWAITAAEPDVCRVWNLQTSHCIVTQATLPRVAHIVFSPDSSFAVVASGDEQGLLQRWTIPPSRGEPTSARLGHKVTHFAFSSDGRKLLFSSGAFASIYDAVTLELVGPPLEHQPELQRAIFSQDGERIATWGTDGTIIVWNTAWRAPITDRTPTGLTDAVGILFDGSGERLITFGKGGARMIDIPRIGPTSPSWLPNLAESVAGQRFQGADGAQPVSIEQFERLRLSLSASAPTADPLIRWAQRFVGKPTARLPYLQSPGEK